MMLKTTIQKALTAMKVMAIIMDIVANAGTCTLTQSTRQTKTYIYANSVDPDETARREPSHQDLYCLPFF